MTDTRREQKAKADRPIDFDSYERVHVVLRLSYFGETYDGLTRQDSTSNTIEHHLIEAVQTLRLVPPLVPGGSPFPEKFSRCGRTDKGVSAFGNAVSLMLRGPKKGSPPGTEVEYARMLNRVLPPDIRIVAWAPVVDHFDARFSCTSRTYHYYFPPCRVQPANNAKRAMSAPRIRLDVAAMQRAANKFEGVHDFRNFCMMDLVAVRSFVRHIYTAKIFVLRHDGSEGPMVPGDAMADVYLCYLRIQGNAFLYHQIRCIMSVLFMVGSGLEVPEVVDTLLDVALTPSKPQYGLAAPEPLILWDCDFGSVAAPPTEGAIADSDDDEPQIAMRPPRVAAPPPVWRLEASASSQLVYEWRRRWEQSIMRSGITASMLHWLHQQESPSAAAEGAEETQIAHVPLMSRPRDASFEDKLAALKGSRKRRRDDNMGKGSRDDE